MQDKSDHHPLTAAALDKNASGDDENSSDAKDFEDFPIGTGLESAEHNVVDSGTVKTLGRAAADLHDLNSAAVTLRTGLDAHKVTRDTDPYAISSAQVSARALEPALNSFQKAAAKRKIQRENME